MDRAVVTAVRFQRNGICGVPFNTLSIEAEIDGEARRFIATVFQGEYREAPDGSEQWLDNGYCAVQEIYEDGTLGDSGWRGDQFESALRRVIELDRGRAELVYQDRRWEVRADQMQAAS
jgi:hypothetical protein